MNRSSATGRAITVSRRFTVKALAGDQAELSSHFARRVSLFAVHGVDTVLRGRDVSLYPVRR